MFERSDDIGWPSISVITPSYNQAAFLEQTIQSVLEQEYRPLEHLVIDGGSTDGSVEILRRYPHLKWLSEPDRGQSDALNKGFRVAKGDIIAWINSDDWYEPGVFRAVADFFLQNPDKNVVMGDCNLVDDKGAVFQKVINTARGFEELRKYWIPFSIPTQPAIFFRASLLKEFGGVDESLHYAMDYDLWLRFAQENRFHHLDQVVANYRFHEEAKGGDQDWAKFTPECERVHQRYVSPVEAPQADRVSVVAYVYNCEKYVAGAIQSILDQTHHEFDLFILDDGSTDGTARIIEGFLDDPRVRFESQPHQGRDRLHETVNRCLQSTSGDLIVIANGDDLLHPQKIERQLATFQRDPELEAVYHDMVCIGADGEELPLKLVQPVGDDILCRRLLGRQMFRSNLIPNPTVMFRRTILERVGMQQGGLIHDYDFWLRAAVAGCRFHFLPESLLLYRVHEESCSTSTRRQVQLRDACDEMRRRMRRRYRIEDLYPEIQFCQDKVAARAAAHLDMAILLGTGPMPLYDLAIQEIHSALSYSPDFPEALNNLGVFHVLHGEPTTGIQHLQAASARHPDPVVTANLRAAESPPGSGRLQLLVQDPGTTELFQLRWRSVGPMEGNLNGRFLAALSPGSESEAVSGILESYFQAFRPEDPVALTILTADEEQTTRLAELFENACKLTGLAEALTPEVTVEQVPLDGLFEAFSELLHTSSAAVIARGSSPEFTQMASNQGCRVLIDPTPKTFREAVTGPRHKETQECRR